MKANILEGVYVRVGGKAGETKGLSWRILESMFGHLQELVSLLAKYELETNLSPNLKDFEIEIFDFKPGSAVPAFRIVPNKQQEFIPVITEQKIVVAEKFDQLMSYADVGAYETFFKETSLPDIRYDIAEELYGFILSAENSPISIVRPNGIQNSAEKFHQIYQVRRFNKEQSEFLLKPRQRRKSPEEPEQILGLIQRVGKRRKIIDLYENKDTILSIAPNQIVLPDKTYHLYSPLVCTVQKEDENFIIENNMLDLYAAGGNIDEAEHDLYNEFDASYQLLNNIPDNELSDRLLRAKQMMNHYIKEITKD